MFMLGPFVRRSQRRRHIVPFGTVTYLVIRNR